MYSHGASFRIRLMLGAMLVACPFVAIGQTPEPTEFLGPPPAQELEVLASLIGAWTVEAKIKHSAGGAESYESQGEAEAKWIHNGHFLQMEGSSQTARGRFSWTELLSYDQRLRQYRRSVFSSEGIIATAVGSWNENELTMTWTATGLPENWSGVVKTRLGEDRVEVSLRVANDRGEVTRESTMTMQRK